MGKRKKNKSNKGEKKNSSAKKGNKRMKKGAMANAIIQVFKASPKEPFNYRQISSKIGADNPVQKKQVVEILNALATDNFISEIDPGRYRYNDWGTTAVGIFTRRQNGKNSFIPEDGGTPIFIAERNSAHALDGDKVKIQIHAKRKGAEPEGEVIEILESRQRTITGKLQVTKGFAFLITEDKTLANDIFIPKEKLKGGKNGDKAVVRITEWPEEAKNPLGEVVDILGRAGENNAEMNAILAEFDLPFTGNSFWYRYAGTIKAGVNLETAEIDDKGDAVTITLDPAYIISNTPDMETSGVLEENNNVLNPIQVGDVDEFQRWCVEQSESQAIEGGLLEEAQTQAEAQLSQLFYAALGDEVSISYVWRDAPAEVEE